MHNTRAATRALLVLTVAATPIACDAQQRPGQGRQPTIPPPTILEYKPQSTLVVPAHEVPRARFPVVDLHGHPPTLDNRQAIEEVVAAMDDLNIGVMGQARPSSGDQLRSQIEAVREAATKLPVILMTGRYEVDFAQRSLDAGASAHLRKPFEEDALLEAIAVATRDRR